MLTGRIWVCFWPAPGASADRNCLLQLKPPSHERAHSWHSQLSLINSCVGKLQHLQAAEHRACRRPAPCPGQEAEREAKSGTQGLPREGRLRPSPLGHSNGHAPSSLHGISCCGTPHQPDHRVSWVCLHRSAAQLMGSAPKDRSLTPCSALSGHIPRQLFSVIFVCASSTLVMPRIRGWKCSP